jgi:hypothetical protein
MNRQRALKTVLGLVGVIFLALTWPMIMFFRQEPSLSMMFSLYATLGIFLRSHGSWRFATPPHTAA